MKDYDGVITVNRNTFANYFRSQLNSYVSSDCILPHVYVWVSGVKARFSRSLSPNQAPTVIVPPTGPIVLAYEYSQSSSDGAGLNWDMGSLELRDTYSLTVEFVGTTIVEIQHQVD